MSVGELKRPRKGGTSVLLLGTILLTLLMLTAWFSRGYIRFWWLFESLGKNEQGYPEYRHRETGIVFVRLPGGTFIMGSPEEEEHRRENELLHEVTLSPFLIAKHEVTNSEWRLVMGDSPSQVEVGDEFPVNSVTWFDCAEFGKATHLRFPTEAQWEYACRGGKRGPVPGAGKLEEMAWYFGNSGHTTHPVGQKRPNDFGLHDMHGNVWEWCDDIYGEDFYQKPESRKLNPVCTKGTERRVARGGDCNIPDILVFRCAYRGSNAPDMRGPVGFRPAYYSLP